MKTNTLGNMKRGWFLACAGIFSLVLTAVGEETPQKTEGIDARSRVSHVIVYPSWAYVTREAELDIPAGFSRFVFRGLPAWIDEDSIRIKIGAADEVVISGANTQKVFLSRSNENEVQKAEREVIRLRDQIVDLKTELASLEEEKKYIQGLTPWKLGKSPQEGAPRMVSLAELRELKNFIQQELLVNMKKANQVNRMIRDTEPDLNAKEKAWQDVKNRGQLEQKDIVVELSAKSPVRTTLAVSYLISGASWYPSYDARADSEKGNVTFTCKAVVQQSTGEDWNGASFALSTIQPYLVREKPEIKPWYINASTVEAETQKGELPSGSLGFRSEGKKERTDKMMAIQQKQQEWNKMDTAAQMAYQAVNDNVFQALKVARLVEERGTTIEFTVNNTYTIRADGKPVNLPVGAAELEAIRRYSAAPAVSRSTYVTGEMRNSSSFVFLTGPVRVYIDGNFMGNSEIDCIAQGETFELYLGLEERIQVTRELDAQKSSTHSSGDRKRLQVAYVIEVKNYLKNQVAVEIRDQIPVSQDSSVKVKLQDLEPRVETVDKGIITWPLKLQPDEVKRLRFEFQVDYPANIYLKNALEIERMLKK